MSDLEKAARAEKARYQRAWRAKNPEKVREMNRRYWMKRAAKAAAEMEGASREGESKS